ncbi:MAG: hypothetical protein ACREVG_19725 [Burkholderiales bacterium]
MMEYKGFIGVVEFDGEAAIVHGDVVNTRDVITFQGKSVAEIKKAFRESVDDYLEFCARTARARVPRVRGRLPGILQAPRQGVIPDGSENSVS